jgi:hypothetical protein
MWVLTRDQDIDAGLFGPQVDQQARMRIGDVVAAARDRAAVVQPRAEPHLSAWPGQHGSLTPAEQLVPSLLVSAARPG